MAEWNPNIFHVLCCQIQCTSAFKDMLVSEEAAPSPAASPGHLEWLLPQGAQRCCLGVRIPRSVSPWARQPPSPNFGQWCWYQGIGALDCMGTKEEKTVPVSGRLCVSWSSFHNSGNSYSPLISDQPYYCEVTEFIDWKQGQKLMGSGNLALPAARPVRLTCLGLVSSFVNWAWERESMCHRTIVNIE